MNRTYSRNEYSGAFTESQTGQVIGLGVSFSSERLVRLFVVEPVFEPVLIVPVVFEVPVVPNMLLTLPESLHIHRNRVQKTEEQRCKQCIYKLNYDCDNRKTIYRQTESLKAMQV